MCEISENQVRGVMQGEQRPPRYPVDKKKVLFAHLRSEKR